MKPIQSRYPTLRPRSRQPIELRNITSWVMVLALAIATASYAQEGVVKYDANPSLISLIVDPMRYDGRLVYTTGVARVEHEGFRIYLSKEDAKHRVVENSVTFDPTDASVDIDRMRKLDGKYVQIGGRLVTEAHPDESGARVGVIKEISMFRRL